MKPSHIFSNLCLCLMLLVPSTGLALKGGLTVSNYAPYPFWQHTVQIRFNEDLCTGFIISERHIATAGHCKQNYSVFTVSFSEPTAGAGNEIRHELSLPLSQFRSIDDAMSLAQYEDLFGFERSQLTPPEAPVLHKDASDFFTSSDSVLEVFPKTGEEYLYDISYSLTDFAIIELPEGMNLPEGFKPIEFFSFADFLKDRSMQDLAQLPFFAVGYGENSYYSETPHREQKLTFLPQKLEAFGRINHEKSLNDEISNLGILFLGALSEDEGSLCFEDSGGPLFVVHEEKLQLAGVGIFEVNTCKFGGFTPISNLEPWLNQELKAD